MGNVMIIKGLSAEAARSPDNAFGWAKPDRKTFVPIVPSSSHALSSFRGTETRIGAAVYAALLATSNALTPVCLDRPYAVPQT